MDGRGDTMSWWVRLRIEEKDVCQFVNLLPIAHRICRLMRA